MTGLKEIQRRRFQFGLITLIVALISYLILMINGLGIGLNRLAGSALLGFDADGLAFARTSERSLVRSELSAETVEEIGQLEGVSEWARLGYAGTKVRDEDGDLTSVAMLGYEPGSLAEPPVTDGRALTQTDGRGLLADKSFLRAAGLSVGDRVYVPSRLDEFEFTIVGEVDEGAFFFQPVAFVLIDTWREVRYGVGAGEVPDASIVLVKGEEVTGLEGGDFEVISKEAAFANIEGVSGQQSTVTALRVFGYLIGALVIGIFFYVLTLQKVVQIGLLKALGASPVYVFRQLLIQVLVIVVVGLALSVPLAFVTARALQRLPDEMPIAFTGGSILTTCLLLLATGLVGTLFSLRHIVRVDPIIALGHQE